MSKIKVNLPDYPVNGKQISFIAPCASSYTECFIINDVMYSVVDADGVSVAGIPNVWNSGAMVSAILNVDTKTAFIQNANTNTYMEGQFQTQTHKLKSSDSLTREDTMPFYSSRDGAHHKVTLAVLKEVLGVESATIVVTTCQGAQVTCTNGETTLTNTGSTQFSLPKNGVWTVTATLGGKTATATVEATGAMKYNVDLMILDKIAVDSAPDKTVYFEGEFVDITGLKVTATYADGTTADVTGDCTISPTTIAADTTAITVSYSNAGLSTTATFPVTVRTLSSIAITTPPAKTAYKYGELFSGAGMVVTATYSDGSTDTVTGWKVSPERALILSDTDITVSYTENRVTKTCTQAITVSNYVTKIAVTEAPAKTGYFNGNAFDPSGMVVTATYADESTRAVTEYIYSPTTITFETTKITISYTEDGVTCTTTQAISVAQVSPVLAENTWEDIRMVSDSGQAANYWSVGDSKPVTINGKVGYTTFTNIVLDAFIIGFDHNSALEGANRIHFQIGRIGDTNVCLCDGFYSQNKEVAGAFCMRAFASNSGGWETSSMRQLLNDHGNTLDPNAFLMNALPQELRSVIKSVTKYTNTGTGATGGNSSATGTEAKVTATEDYLFLVSEFEVAGKRNDANVYEQNYQQQYEYYKAGNSAVAKKYNDTSKAAIWWTRSNSVKSDATWCAVNSSGASYSYSHIKSYGICPCFCV